MASECNGEHTFLRPCTAYSLAILYSPLSSAISHMSAIVATSSFLPPMPYSRSLFMILFILQHLRAFSILPSFLYSRYLSASILYERFLNPYVFAFPTISILL